MPRNSPLVVAALLLCRPGPLFAQSKHCFRPAPPPACSGFITFELEYGHPFVQTKSRETFQTFNGPESIRVEDVDQYLMWRLGRMRNQSDGQAIGASLDVGFSQRGWRVGVEGTKRYWQPNKQALDLSLGVVQLEAVRSNMPGETERRLALTGAAQYAADDLVAAMLRADVAPGSHTTAALYGGAQLRSTGTVFGTVLVGFWVALAIAVLSDPNY